MTDLSTYDPDEPLARELYATHCAVMGEEPNWGRGGFKTQVMLWLALARKAREYTMPAPGGPVCSVCGGKFNLEVGAIGDTDGKLFHIGCHRRLP